MLAAAALGALGAQLAEIRAAKGDWFVGAGRVDKQGVFLEADGAVSLCAGNRPSTGRSATSPRWIPRPKARPSGDWK